MSPTSRRSRPRLPGDHSARTSPAAGEDLHRVQHRRRRDPRTAAPPSATTPFTPRRGCTPRFCGPIPSSTAISEARSSRSTPAWSHSGSHSPFKDLELHDELLGIAFVGRNDPYRPLAEHIAELLADTQSLDQRPILEPWPKTPTTATLNNNSDPKLTHAVIDGKRVPLDRTAALYIAQQTHLLALGDPKRAAEMVAEAELAGNNGTSATAPAPSPDPVSTPPSDAGQDAPRPPAFGVPSELRGRDPNTPPISPAAPTTSPTTSTPQSQAAATTSPARSKRRRPPAKPVGSSRSSAVSTSRCLRHTTARRARPVFTP